MKFRRAILITVILQSIGLALSAIFILLTARWLGPANKGVQSLLVVGGQVGAVVLSLGFQGAIPAVVAATPSRAHAASAIEVRLLLIGALVLFLTMGLNAYFSWIVSIRGYELDIALFLFATMVQLYLASVSMALMDYWTSNISTAVSAGATLVIAWLFWLTVGLTPRTAVLSQSLGLAAGSATVLLRMWSRIAPRLEGSLLDDLRDYRSASVLGFLSSVFGLLMFRGDIFLVTRLGGGVRIAGIYAIAAFTAELCLRVPQWAGAILTPNVAADALGGRLRTIKLLWLSVGLSTAAYLLAIALKGVAGAVLRRIAGSDYLLAYPMLLALFPRIILQSGWAILSNNLAGKGFTVFHPAATLFGMLGVWGAEWFFIPREGLLFGIAATSLGYLVAMAIIYAGFLRHNDLSPAQFLAISVSLLRRRTSQTLVGGK